MKDDFLNLNARVATVLDIATWLWIGSVLFLTSWAAWLLIKTIRHAAASFARAVQLTNDIQQPRKEES